MIGYSRNDFRDPCFKTFSLTLSISLKLTGFTDFVHNYWWFTSIYCVIFNYLFGCIAAIWM